MLLVAAVVERFALEMVGMVRAREFAQFDSVLQDNFQNAPN